MNLFQKALESLSVLYQNLIRQPDWRTYLDIAIMTAVIYQIIKVLARTRASGVFKGIGVLLFFACFSTLLQLNVVTWAIQQIVNIGAIVLVVLFQPELRRGLEQIGRSHLKGNGVSRGHNKSAEHHVSDMVQAMSNMSRKRIGALIVVERNTGLREFIESGTILDAEISAPLIENIFEPNTPLHDGAVIIRDQRIIAASCILQLSEDHTISRELGTRHRAAIGVSETTDAVSFVVSEETGIISMTREGRLTRYLDTKALTAVLSELFLSEENPVSVASLFKKKENDDEK